VADAGPGGGTAVTVDAAGCGTPAASLPAGPVRLTVTDRADAYVSVYLVSRTTAAPAASSTATTPDPGLAYAEIDWLTPGRTLPLDTTLAAGRYALRCVFTDGTVRTSRTITVSGHTTGAVRGVHPVPDLALGAPVAAYRRYVSAALPGLVADCRTLDRDVARGDLTAARADWLPAHLDYERLGAAYNSFGDFDDALDGLAPGPSPAAAARGTGWTGFHRVEFGLWHRESAARLRPYTRRLAHDAAAMKRDFPSADTDPGDLPLRAHEILENTLQFQLTGEADYGSGTVLATTSANLAGTREVLSVLRPLLTGADPAFVRPLDSHLAAFSAALDAARVPGAPGGRPPPARLPAAKRQRIDGTLGALLETLAAVPDLLAPRTSA
jgi:iron uptake system EfeUOB component EfeO/EfeM